MILVAVGIAILDDLFGHGTCAAHPVLERRSGETRSALTA
jgi:hypothetical protein